MLALAAAEESGQLATIVAAAEAAGLDPDDLHAGERAGLAAIAGGVLAWRHPLARSAAYRAIAPDRRRALHAALAGVLGHRSQLDRRAWHLAAAALGPDDRAATALDGAARRARARSAHASAAAAAGRAAALSASPDERARRLYDAAEAAWLGGHATRALQSIEEALALAPEPGLRAELDHLRGQATIRAGELMQGHEILVAGAQAIERVDPAKAVVMLAEAAEACIYAARPRRMLEVSRRAWELLPAGAGERERFFANLALGTASLYNGVGEDGAVRIREALAILEASETLSREPRSLSAAALGPLWLRDSGDERALIERGVASARARGALGTLPLALALVARDAATSDRPALATALFEEAAGLARETRQEMPLCAALTWLAGVDARQGREAECRAHAEEAMALAARRGLAFLELWALEALGELELGLGNAAAARERLERRQRLLEELDLEDPDLSPVPDLIEIAVRAGEPPPSAEPLARRAAAKGQPWALARHARAVALLAPRDDLDAAFARALELHAQTHDRFETARTRLCYGERLRRNGQRIRARAELRRALDAFEALGAEPWAERARAELQASGEVARRRDPSTLDDLTPQELQIGMLLAGGATTREVATQLFLSPKTVEYHLRNAYRKLGIHSRDELAASLAQDQGGT
jgi:DNA-binding CsgD family transcriptional regulator